jgi:catechol 2,3-dioxygenase-like lactoylglutathione lyase family enzyme
VGEEDFDRIFGRIQAEGIPFGSEPGARENMTINRRGGGRGVYFCDQNGLILELLTVE